MVSERPKSSPEAPKSAQETPKTLPDPSQMEPKTLPSLIWKRSRGFDFPVPKPYRFLIVFSLIFCCCLIARTLDFRAPVEAKRQFAQNQIWEGLVLHLGGFGHGLGRLLGALGRLLAIFLAFKIELLYSIGPRWAPRGLLD